MEPSGGTAVTRRRQGIVGLGGRDTPGHVTVKGPLASEWMGADGERSKPDGQRRIHRMESRC